MCEASKHSIFPKYPLNFFINSEIFIFNKALDHGLYQMGLIHSFTLWGPLLPYPAAVGFYPTGNVFIGLDSLAITPKFQHNMDNGEELIIC